MVSAKAAVCSVDTPFQIRMMMRSNAKPASCTLYHSVQTVNTVSHEREQNDVRHRWRDNRHWNAQGRL